MFIISVLKYIYSNLYMIEYSALKRPGYRGSGTIVPQQ